VLIADSSLAPNEPNSGARLSPIRGCGKGPYTSPVSAPHPTQSANRTHLGIRGSVVRGAKVIAYRPPASVLSQRSAPSSPAQATWHRRPSRYNSLNTNDIRATRHRSAASNTDEGRPTVALDSRPPGLFMEALACSGYLLL